MNYRKLRKLVISPKLFFIDFLNKKITNEEKKSKPRLVKKFDGPVSVVFGFNLWKRAFLEKYYPQRSYEYIPLNSTEKSHEKIKSILNMYGEQVDVLVWGKKLPDHISDFCNQRNIPVKYIEDGFIRSVRLGVEHVWPRSLTLDSGGNHFEYQKETDIERLLLTYDFNKEPFLLERSKGLISKIVENNISKYNNSRPLDNIDSIYGEKKCKRVLVVGQIESDASIKYGSEVVKTTYELLKLACDENPGAQIIYKEHPDILIGKQTNSSDMTDLVSRCWVLKKDIPLSQSFSGVDHVYVITSLSGFEALIRGIKVTVLGCPFYSGWGLTDDRQRKLSRNRKLTIEQLFAIAYITYPKYFNPTTGDVCTPEETIDEIIKERELMLRESAESSFETSCEIVSKPSGSHEKFDVEAVSISDDAIFSSNPVRSESIQSKSIESNTTQEKSDEKKSTIDKSIFENSSATKVKDKVTTEKTIALPAISKCFNPFSDNDINAVVNSKVGVFCYFPWIFEHTNSLINKIGNSESYKLLEINLFSGLQSDDTRRQVSRFAKENPALYRQMVVRRLAPLRNKICGVIFTFDWAAPMRIISSVCLDLGIPRILIPHESVFVDRDKYYWDVTGQASLPAADIILGWGSLQKEIFVERGYPAERFEIVGAPKFDTYKNYQPYLEREQFCQLHGLDPDKKIILFAAQPLDSQLDQAMARASQREAIKDLITYTAEHNLQLLIRTPPSKDVIINAVLRTLMDTHAHVAVDNALCYMVTAEETLYHCDVITSINSTMLFEGLLLGKPAISMKYIEFDQIWQKVGIPAVRSYNELQQLLNEISANNWVQTGIDFSWASSAFGIGEFDGQAATRISNYLSAFAVKPPTEFSQNKPITRLFNGETVDVVGIPSAVKTLETIQRYLKSLLGARTIVPTQGEIENSTICSVDIFFQWGITPNPHKQQQAKLAKSLGKPVVIIEDGFIRSLDIGLSGEPGLSIILDDVTAYYDATKISRLSRLLEQGRELTSAELQRAQSAVEMIVGNKVSKYNHAPILPVHIGESGRKKILLIDQRYGDQSVTSGLADEHTFNRMLQDAINKNPDCDIIIKQHPDAIKGGKSSYFSNERLAFTQHMDHIYLVNYDINPYSLLELVDEVYVATSGMGFEALMAGKKVHCYGMPFYAGWGLTEDQITLPSRTRNRSLPEVFYFAYIELSRYFNPEQNCVVDVESIVDHVIKYRCW